MCQLRAIRVTQVLNSGAQSCHLDAPIVRTFRPFLALSVHNPLIFHFRCGL